MALEDFLTPARSFFTGPDVSSVNNVPALEARRRIVQTMLAANARKGYPKNLGEGLTAIGDALGERATMNQMMRMEIANQAAAEEAARKAVPDEAKPPPANEKVSELTPDDDSAIPFKPVRLAENTPEATPPQPAPDVPQAQPAALPPNPQRDSIAMALAGQGVPQPNPMLAGGQIPSLLQGPTASPQGAGGLPPDVKLAALPPAGTMTDAPPPGFAPKALPAAAQAQGIVKAPLTDVPTGPLPPMVQPNPQFPAVSKPLEPPMNADEKRGWALRAKGLALGDPGITAQGQNLIAYGAAQRKQDYDQAVKQWEADMETKRQDYIREQGYARTFPTQSQEYREKQYAIGAKGAFGGLSEQEVLDPVKKSQVATANLAQGVRAIREAQQVAPQIFSGMSGEFDLTAAKAKAALGFPADPRIAATEKFMAYIMPAVAVARQAQSGGANISDNDMKLALQAVAGRITLDPKSINAILEELQRVSTKVATWHQERVVSAGGDDPNRVATMLATYGLPMHDIVDPRAVADLRNDPTLAGQFDAQYRTPGLARRILGGR